MSALWNSSGSPQRLKGGVRETGSSSDHAEGFALEDGEADIIDRFHRRGLAVLGLDPEVLAQTFNNQQRLGRATAITFVQVAHIRTSIAARIPSLTRLKQIEVMKIATPGIAQIQGLT